MASPRFVKGAVFWLDAEKQTESHTDKGHFWVVLAVLGEKVLWVPLSSFKPWLRLKREDTYIFNVGKSNKYIDARQDTCPLFRFAEVLPVSDLELKNPKPRGNIPDHHVAGICNALPKSGEIKPSIAKFLAEAERRTACN